MKRTFPSIVSAIALALLLALGGLAGSGVAYAADGDLDPDFDADGRVTTDFANLTDIVTAVAVQPDGKIVASGYEYLSDLSDFTVARYYPDGTLDTGFSGDGKQRIDFNISDNSYAMALQPDGKIVLAGTTNASTNDFALARLNPNGTLDTSFSFDGKVTTDFAGGEDGGSALAIQPDGNIVVAGRTGLGGNDDFLVARYNSDGTLDTGFSGDGWVTTDFVGTQDQARALAIYPDGKIVVGGHAIVNGSVDFAVARYNPNGTLDTTFGFGGKMAADFSGDEDRADDVAIQADGRIVAAGRAAIGNEDDFAVVRFNTNGTLDTGFSDDGWVTTDFSAPNDYAHALAIYPDGKIVVAGKTSEVFALARYNANGTLDTSFSGDGMVTTAFQGSSHVNDIAIQADGRIIAAGTNTDYALARYQSGGAVTPTPSLTSTPTPTLTSTPTYTPTAISTSTPSRTSTVTVTMTSTATTPATFTATSTRTPTVTSSPTGTSTGTQTNTPTLTATATATGTGIPTITATSSSTWISTVTPPPTNTFTGTPTSTGTGTATPTLTHTATPSYTRTPEPTQTTGSPSATSIVSNTPTPTDTSTSTGTSTSTATVGTMTSTATVPQPTDTLSVPTATATPTACPLQFEDVPSDHTFYTFVRCMVCRGIVNGYPCGGPGEPCVPPGDNPYFRPGNLVTRGQIAKIVSNSAGFSEPVSEQTFEDVPPGSTFYDFIGRLEAREVMSGYPCGGPGEPCMPPADRPYFRPSASATRGQISKIVSNAAGFQEPVSGQTFQDVPPGSTFYEVIERLASREVMQGYPCGGPGEPCIAPDNRPYFRPGANVTRGQTSKIVANAFFPGCDTPGK